MAGKNRGICHSCRQPGHTLFDCSKKRSCRNCGEGFLKWMEVEKNSANKGRMFHCCSRDCRFFKWCDVSPYEDAVVHDEGGSSGSTSGSYKLKDPSDDLSNVFRKYANIADQNDYLEMSVNITFRKGKRDPDDNEKEKN